MRLEAGLVSGLLLFATACDDGSVRFGQPGGLRIRGVAGAVGACPLPAGVPEAPDSGKDAKPKRPKPSKPGDVAPPMPGRVVKVLVVKDQSVKVGDPLLIIEAMKMESRVPAPVDGRVVAILVSEGENVKTDETLIQLE